jgi:hypothetical protein
LRQSIQGGNWSAAESMARSLPGCLLPVTQPELEGYLNALKHTVIMAKASRSIAAATLARVRAAERFQVGGYLSEARQNFADSADFSRPSTPSPPTSSTT